MRLALPFFMLLGAAFAAEDGAVLRARQELTRTEQLVTSGVLPRGKLEQAKDALADAMDDATLRSTLYEKDITVEQADRTVEITGRRVARHQLAVDKRNDLLQQGIIAKSEMSDFVAALDQAKREHDWAVTRAKLARELAELARNEQEMMRQMELSASTARPVAGVEHFAGSGKFDPAQFPLIEQAFEKRFAHSLPVSAMGETEVHRALGFDHRNRIDVALPPDQPEGLWLRHYLATHDIPYFAFRTAVAHKATGAHIHIGPASLHYVAQVKKVGHAGKGSSAD